MRIKDGFVLEEVGGSYLAVAVGERADSFNGMVRMNGTGAFLWNKMQESEQTVESLLSEMTAVYDVPSDVALTHINAFIDKLKSAGIIE